MRARFRHYRAHALTALRDAVSGRSHSRDFAYARGDYLRSRTVALALLFLGLLPFWALLDPFMLPDSSRSAAYPARAIMLVALIGVLLLAWRGRIRLGRARLAAGLLFLVPASFYAVILTRLPPGTSSLVGYDFIPYMLVGMLAIFPFTLLEALVMGLALIALEAWALASYGRLMTLAGLQALWLLAALLSIAITANYFQLRLMLRLYREATHDPLSSLLNRGALMRAVNQLNIGHPERKVAILMMDLDHFKRINDQHGHTTGDDVLRNFAEVLRTQTRHTDILARYGGEEFMAVLPDRDRDTALAVAERIRRNTETQTLLNLEGEPLRYTVSIGVTMLAPHEQFEQAVLRADRGLYEAKKQSRNCVVGV